MSENERVAELCRKIEETNEKIARMDRQIRKAGKLEMAGDVQNDLIKELEKVKSKELVYKKQFENELKKMSLDLKKNNRETKEFLKNLDEKIRDIDSRAPKVLIEKFEKIDSGIRNKPEFISPQEVESRIEAEKREWERKRILAELKSLKLFNIIKRKKLLKELEKYI